MVSFFVCYFNFSHSGGHVVVYHLKFFFIILISSDVEYLGPEFDRYLGGRFNKSK